MAQFGDFDIIIHYYIYPGMEPIIKQTTGTYASSSMAGFEAGYHFSGIEIKNFMTIPPHITFLGWYCPHTGAIQNSFTYENEEDIPQPFELYAQWEINSKFNFKDTLLLDFNSGGVNVTPNDLLKGSIIYDANGFPIQGAIESIAEVSF